MNRAQLAPVALFLTLALMAVACSGSVEFSFGGSSSPAEGAADLIEGDDMADLLGLGPITGATCQEPPTSDVGTIFSCVAMVEAGELEFEVEIDREDHIFASPVNVISQDTSGQVAVAAVEALNAQNGWTLPEEAIDCGDSAYLIADPTVLDCALTDPDTSEIYDTSITVTDLDTGAFSVDIADSPRS